MGKKPLVIFLIILIAATVQAVEECGRFTLSTDIPCIVVSTTRPDACSNHNVSVFNQNGTLVSNTTWEEYPPKCSFNFTQTTIDTYYYNGTTSLEEGVINVQRENNMLAIVIGSFIVILGFVGLGFISQGIKIKLLTYGMALIETIIMVSLLYAREMNIDITGIMRVNFLTILILGFGIGMISIIMHIYNIVNLANTETEDTDKWKNNEKW